MAQFKSKWSFSVKNWNQGNFNGRAPRNNNFYKALVTWARFISFSIKRFLPLERVISRTVRNIAHF
jgi:hypothetical protein